jgi:ribosomal protein S18 acetylase RimI-like enzyme
MIDHDEKVIYETASGADLRSIASIHKDSLGVGILSNCGINFLERMYASIMKVPSNSIVVAKYNGRVIGFIVGIVEDVSPLGSLRLDSLLILLFNSIRKPYLFISAITVFKNINRDFNRPGDIEISHLAVDARYREMGVGTKLISIIERKAMSRGFKSIFTRTHNNRLVKFYKSKFNASEESRFSTPKIDYVMLKWQVDKERL